jgi:hypothetical protein
MDTGAWPRISTAWPVTLDPVSRWALGLELRSGVHVQNGSVAVELVELCAPLGEVAFVGCFCSLAWSHHAPATAKCIADLGRAVGGDDEQGGSGRAGPANHMPRREIDRREQERRCPLAGGLADRSADLCEVIGECVEVLDAALVEELTSPPPAPHSRRSPRRSIGPGAFVIA